MTGPRWPEEEEITFGQELTTQQHPFFFNLMYIQRTFYFFNQIYYRFWGVFNLKNFTVSLVLFGTTICKSFT